MSYYSLASREAELLGELEKAREDNVALLKKEEALRDNKSAALKNKADMLMYSDIIRKKELYSIVEKFENVKNKDENIAKNVKHIQEMMAACPGNAGGAKIIIDFFNKKG